MNGKHKDEFKITVRVYDPVLKKHRQKSGWFSMLKSVGDIIDKEIPDLFNGACEKLYADEEN